MRQFFTQSISRLVMGSFVFVLLLPLGFIISNLSQISWDSAQKELQEKHLLTAKSLSKPISLYFDSYQLAFHVFADSTNFSEKNSDQIKTLIDDFVNSLDNVAAISFLSSVDSSAVVSINDQYKLRTSENISSLPYHDTEAKYRKYDTVNSISSVVKSSISNKPVVLLKHHIIGIDLNKKGTLFAEIDLAPVRDICNKVKFGEKGHCAIVDQLGQVVAHPNKEWVSGVHDLSSIKIVNRMKNLGSGLWTFDSPFIGEKVVTGFATIDKLGWGVMVNQPKSELESPFKSVINTVLTWLIVGIIVSLLVAYILTQQITKPLNSLVIKSREIGTRSDTFNLGTIPKDTPTEVSDLWSALSALVSRLHKSNKEVRKLNYSLNRDIEKATEKLRATNKYLYKISSNDHLTNIANRRYFEDTVNKIIKKGIKEKIGIILIDVDKFKFINDEYGHEAGDKALIHIASLMKKCTRNKDIPARLGGDEFIIYIRNCDDATLMKIAENLRQKVESTPIVWEEETIKLSLSVGIVNYGIDKEITLEQLIKYADEAMYVSKEAGRNHVSAYTAPKPLQKEITNKPVDNNDPLTNITSKKYFEDSVNKILSKPIEENAGIILINVDKLKSIHEGYSYKAGDLALAQIAATMQGMIRQKDILARLDGSIFVIYIRNCSDEIITKIAENLRIKVKNNPLTWEGEIIKLSLSVGVVNYNLRNKVVLGKLLKMAAKAMHTAKKAGGNQISIYSNPDSSTNTKPKVVEIKTNGAANGGLALAGEIEKLLEELPHEPEELPYEPNAQPELKKQDEADNYWQSVIVK